jgi:hypothetical protein
MIEWHDRTIEERNLLNPAFCAIVLWHLARGFQTEGAEASEEESGLPIQLAFIGTSFILRGQTRNQLPRTVATSLTAWIHDHPIERSAVAKGVVVLRPYIREALIFGAQHRAISLAGTSLSASESLSKQIANYLRQSSVEVRDCARQAQFVGRWLRRSGTAPTIMALLGVQA